MSDKIDAKESKEMNQEEEIVVVYAEPLLLQTKIRERVEPYLPPPVVQGWRHVDPILEPYLGPEPTVTLVGSVLLGILVWQVLKILSSVSSGRAIVDDDDDQVIASQNKTDDFVATILLCGAPNSGKTRLFYQLCYGQTNVSTVTSLRANIDVSPEKIRFVDNPGHASLSSPQFLDTLDVARGIVLVLDTTQPVAPVADVLYQLLAHANKKKKLLDIFVACHKTDAPKAKNWRRIKIQLRTELERLLKVRGMEQENESDLWWTPGKPLDLENGVPNAELQFCSTSCESGVGIQELTEFCNGDMTPDAIAKVELI